MSATTLLAAVETALAVFQANGFVEEYTIDIPGGGTRTVRRSSLEELVAWRDQLLAEVASARTGGNVQYFRRGCA